jgi:hypothetical protein
MADSVPGTSGIDQAESTKMRFFKLERNEFNPRLRLTGRNVYVKYALAKQIAFP